MTHPIPDPIPFVFPADSPHAGIPLGNGAFGALVWGSGNILHVTINRQDYWQHAGEIAWQENIGYQRMCEYVLSHPKNTDDPAIMGLTVPGAPPPTRLPVGRFDLVLSGAVQSAELEPATGAARISTVAGLVEIVLSRSQPLLVIRGPLLAVTPIPNNSLEVAAYRQKYHMPEPVLYRGGMVRGWIQESLDRQVLCAASSLSDAGLGGASVADRVGIRVGAIACVLSRSAADAREIVSGLLASVEGHSAFYEDVLAHSTSFYQKYWQQSAWVKVEHRPTQVLFDLGMIKLSGLTQPGGPAPTLQGPWVEDDRMPPWGSDYHFNINYQMCHWPMLAGNHLEQFEPGIRMIRGWLPKMSDYARKFCGATDALMLPHAVDDRCIPADTYWPCQFDPGSVGWTALIYWDLYRYGGDHKLLSDFTYPLLRGALRLYEAMLKETPTVYVLPLAPSPEFFPTHEGLDHLADWGENPSFQLAILHGLLRAALHTVEILGIDEPAAQGWRRIQNRLPKTCEQDGRIMLFKDLDLVKSHRHHSHLAGIYPFDILDLQGTDRELVQRSLARWVERGNGLWSGWCMPWAAILWARMQQATAAGAILDQYQRFFTGPNYASRHDAVADGFTLLRGSPHIMQIDAAMGAVAAILEMLAHERNGQICLAPAVPEFWGDVSFGSLRLPGGRLARGIRQNGQWIELEVSEPEFQV